MDSQIPRAALIVEHMQNDLTLPNGPAACHRGDEIVRNVKELASYPGWAYRVATLANVHPDHCIFAANHKIHVDPGETIDHVDPVAGEDNPTIKATTFHTINLPGSEGQKLRPEIDDMEFHLRLDKFTNPEVITHSCFTDLHGYSFDQLPEGSFSHDLLAKLRERGIQELYICGVGGDMCVKATAIDGVRRGFRVFVVRDAIGFHRRGTEGASEQEMTEKGVSLITMKDQHLRRIKSG